MGKSMSPISRRVSTEEVVPSNKVLVMKSSYDA